MPDDTTPEEKTVPYERFKAMADQKNAASKAAAEHSARVAELEAALEAATKSAATADGLSQQVRELKAEAKKREAAWAEERGIYQSGVTDPETIGLARYLHSTLPEEGRPAFVDWLKAAAAEPANAPKALQPYFAKPEAPKTEEPPPAPEPKPPALFQQQPPAPAPKPAPPGIPSPGQPATTPQWTPEAAAEARRNANGDPATLRALLQQQIAGLNPAS